MDVIGRESELAENPQLGSNCFYTGWIFFFFGDRWVDGGGGGGGGRDGAIYFFDMFFLPLSVLPIRRVTDF